MIGFICFGEDPVLFDIIRIYRGGIINLLDGSYLIVGIRKELLSGLSDLISYIEIGSEPIRINIQWPPVS